MKKYIIPLLALSFLTTACNKKSGGNKSIITSESYETEITDNNGKIDSSTTTSYKKEVNGKVSREESFVYTGLDNSKAKIIFVDTDKEHTITIEANKRKFQLDKINEADGKINYERNGIKAEVKGDSLFIIQGDNVIPLKKTKI